MYPFIQLVAFECCLPPNEHEKQTRNGDIQQRSAWSVSFVNLLSALRTSYKNNLLDFLFV